MEHRDPGEHRDPRPRHHDVARDAPLEDPPVDDGPATDAARPAPSAAEHPTTGANPRAVPGGPLHVVAVAHGTDSAEGRRMIDRLRGGVADRLAAELADSSRRVHVHEAYVDVQEPRLGDVLAGLPTGEEAVVLPMLVCDGVHTVHDIADAVAQRPGTAALPPIAAGLTAAVRLARGLADLVPAAESDRDSEQDVERHGEAGRASAEASPPPAPAFPQAASGWSPGPTPPAVVLAVAGTRRPEGQVQALRLAELVSAVLGSRVEAAFCSAAEPRVGDVVARHRSEGRDAVVLSVLLGEGFFQDRLRSTGARYVSPPLLSPAASSAAMLTECLAGTVLERLRESPS